MSERKPGPISWEEAAKISPDYAEILETEELGHELCIDEHGTVRWVENPEREQEMMEMFGAKDLNDLFRKGADKNDPLIRELYKNMGYSLYGFWEIFYWEVNNPHAHKYLGRKQGKKRVKFTCIVEVDNDEDEERLLDEISDALITDGYFSKKTFGAISYRLVTLTEEEE